VCVCVCGCGCVCVCVCARARKHVCACMCMFVLKHIVVCRYQRQHDCTYLMRAFQLGVFHKLGPWSDCMHSKWGTQAYRYGMDDGTNTALQSLRFSLVFRYLTCISLCRFAARNSSCIASASQSLSRCIANNPARRSVRAG
jgi:hypothetical protein